MLNSQISAALDIAADRHLAIIEANELRAEWIAEKQRELGLLDLDSFCEMNEAAQEVSRSQHFSLWTSGPDDDERVWFCLECESEADYRAGCKVCGNKQLL